MKRQEDSYQESRQEGSLVRKPYTKPILRVYGDLRDITLASTPDSSFESGKGVGWKSGPYDP